MSRPTLTEGNPSTTRPTSSVYSSRKTEAWESTEPARAETSLHRPTLSIMTDIRNSLLRSNSHRRDARRSPSSTRSIIDAAGSPSNAAPIPSESLERQSHSRSSARPTTSRSHTHHRAAGLLRDAADEGDPLAKFLLYRRRRKQDGHQSARRKLLTAATWKRKDIRSDLTLSIVLAITLLAAVGTYVGLAVSKLGSGPMFHVLSILLIIALLIFCTVCSIRMVLTIVCPQKKRASRVRPRPPRARRPKPATADEAYAAPEEPIAVTFARDEETLAENVVELSEKVMLRPPPPTYGVWRESVKLDPNLVHWRRNPSSQAETAEPQPVPVDLTAVRRPPSYGFEDEVEAAIGIHNPIQHEDNLELIHPLERERLVRLLDRQAPRTQVSQFSMNYM